LAFHGGEPLLVGKQFFSTMMDYFKYRLRSFNMHYSLQTNAVLIDDEWIDILTKYQIDVAASIDGPPSVNGLNRVFHSGKDSSAQAMAGIKKLNASDVRFAGVICVVQPYANGGEVTKFLIDELDIKWFDLLLPDYTYDEIPENWQEIQEQLLGYMIAAFEQWSQSERRVVCRYFENIIARLHNLSSRVETIGIGGLHSMVLETDGTLEPHDALRICNGFDRTTNVLVGPGAIEKLMNSRAYQEVLPNADQFSEQCKSCSVFSVCQAGHYMHRYATTSGFRNPSVHCHVLFGLIKHIWKVIQS
jgi:uncharacterized protein